MERPGRTSTRLKVGALVFGLFVAAAAPAFGHAGFIASGGFNNLPNTSGGTGAPGSTPPYAPNTNITMYLWVPYEQTAPFNGAADTTVDVKVIVPSGWTNPACGAAKTNRNDATTNSTNQPGTLVAGWTCVVETSGANTVLHWSGPQVTPPATHLDSAQWFEFTVTTPSPETQTTYNGSGGTEGFIVDQAYASGFAVRWIPSAGVPGGGIVAGILVRTVAGAGVTTTTTSTTVPGTAATLTCALVTPTSGAPFVRCRAVDRDGLRRVRVIDTTTRVTEQEIVLARNPMTRAVTFRIDPADGHTHRVRVIDLSGNATVFLVTHNGTVTSS